MDLIVNNITYDEMNNGADVVDRTESNLDDPSLITTQQAELSALNEKDEDMMSQNDSEKLLESNEKELANEEVANEVIEE